MNFLNKWKKSPTLEEIWQKYEKKESLSKKEMEEILKILEEKNKIYISEIHNLKEYIDHIQVGFNISQSRLIQKLNMIDRK